jgi:hypothetical protein
MIEARKRRVPSKHKEYVMSRWPLPRLLLVDAFTCAAMGFLLIAVSGWLEQLTGIPGSLLFYLGIALLPIAMFMVFVGLQKPVSPIGAMTVIAGNGLWVLGSILLLVTPWISPTGFGSAFIAIQAAAVLLLALFEWRAFRGLPLAST